MEEVCQRMKLKPACPWVQTLFRPDSSRFTKKLAHSICKQDDRISIKLADFDKNVNEAQINIDDTSQMKLHKLFKTSL